MSSATASTKEPTPMKFHGSPEIKTCPEHGEYEAHVLNILGGKPRYHRCPKCAEEARKVQEEAEKRAEDQRLCNLKASIFSNSGIPKRFASKALDDYNTGNDPQKLRALSIAKKYAADFKKRQSEGCSLVLCGKPGTGKTHIVCGIANYLMEQYLSVRYSTVYNAVMAVKSTYRRESDQTESAVIQSFTQPDLLILDEVGVQFGSDTEKMILYHIINGRYDEILPTIMVSNLPEKDLSAYIGDRCIDRMREGGGAVIAFDWVSHRK